MLQARSKSRLFLYSLFADGRVLFIERAWYLLNANTLAVNTKKNALLQKINFSTAQCLPYLNITCLDLIEAWLKYSKFKFANKRIRSLLCFVSFQKFQLLSCRKDLWRIFLIGALNRGQNTQNRSMRHKNISFSNLTESTATNGK